MSLFEEICQLLDTYRGRDKILRTLCYTMKLVGGLSSLRSEKVGKKFLFISSNISSARTTLRFLDDLPMLKYNLQYGFGKGEQDKIIRILNVITNVIDQIYYPIEKIAWLADNQIVDGLDGNRWDTLSTACWVASIYLNLMITLRELSQIHNSKYSRQIEALEGEKLSESQYMHMLSCVRLSLDFIQAVNYLPKGFLWSANLNHWQIGLVATCSSFMGLYQMLRKNKK